VLKILTTLHHRRLRTFVRQSAMYQRHLSAVWDENSDDDDHDNEVTDTDVAERVDVAKPRPP